MDFKLRPARDLGLSPGARLRSLSREPGLVGLSVQAAWRGCVRTYLRVAHGLRVAGAEHLPPPPFVLVANHTSHLDALALMAALRGQAARRAHALAAEEVFFGSTAGAAFAAYALSALPVRRGRTGRQALATLRARLEEDALVFVLFPEGTRARDGVMAAFQPGVGALVCGTAVPVVPAAIGGAFACWPAARRWPRPGPLSVRIGPPVVCADLADTPRDWVVAAARAEAAVRALTGPAGAVPRPGAGDPPSSPPG
jgi:1-acyl-sn-glycerol-3-phosphate acyltransferase